MTDPHDPLSGLDPYPRQLIDTVDLHQERADLLEAIVSTSSKLPTSSRSRVLLAVAVAAALAVIAGLGWFIAADDDDHPTRVAEQPTSVVTSAPPTASASPGSGASRASGSASSAVARRCPTLHSRNGQLSDTLSVLKGVVRRGRDGRVRVYLATKGGHRHLVVVDRRCRVRFLRSLSAVRPH